MTWEAKELKVEGSLKGGRLAVGIVWTSHEDLVEIYRFLLQTAHPSNGSRTLSGASLARVATSKSPSPRSSSKPDSSELTCGCGQVFGTLHGLQIHKGRKGHRRGSRGKAIAALPPPRDAGRTGD